MELVFTIIYIFLHLMMYTGIVDLKEKKFTSVHIVIR